MDQTPKKCDFNVAKRSFPFNNEHSLQKDNRLLLLIMCGIYQFGSFFLILGSNILNPKINSESNT